MSERSNSFSSGLFADEVDCRDDDPEGTVAMAFEPTPVQQRRPQARDARLLGLANLASVDIETSLVTDLSGTLHSLFDPVCDKTLPIYFGPLLGRLYLEGL